MASSPTLTKPSQLHDITLRLQHLKLREQPEDLLYSLHFYTKGYRRLIELVGAQVEPNLIPTFQLDYVERGSIKLKNKIGYKPSFINWLGYQIARLLADDITDENLIEKVSELEENTANFIEETCPHDDLMEQPDPYIDPIVFAEIMSDFSNAGKTLQPKEHFEVIESIDEEGSTNVIPFDRSFRSFVSISELKKAKPQPFDGDDTFIAVRPCNVGDGAWWVKSTITQRAFYVRIKDSEWLAKYQSGKLPTVVANDLISVNLVCDVVPNKKKGSRNVNAYVTKVYKVEKAKFLNPDNQTKLFE